MMVKGVSVIVCACGLDLRPNLMRAMGSSVGSEGQSITVYLSRSQSAQLLQDIASTGHLAVVFTQPHSHRAIQIKAADARIRSADDTDVGLLVKYRASMEQELALIGFDAAFTRAMYNCGLDDLVAVSFTPQQAFDQTPGPRAGNPLPPDGMPTP